MRNASVKWFAAVVLMGTVSAMWCTTAVALVDPIPAGWTLVEDDDPSWTINGGASYTSTDEIPQLKKRLPKGNNSHIGIWEFIGANAEIQFDGQGVRIYGYQPGEGGKADIYIDKKLEKAGVVWDPKAAFKPDHLFFEKKGLSKGRHTLTIKSVAPGFETLGLDGASVPTIDYILVQGKGSVVKTATPVAEEPIPAGGAETPTTYRVRGDVGNDSNNGTSYSSAFQTIQKGADVARAGDTVLVYAGTYRERVKPRRGGTSENARIVYTANPGDKVKITALDTWSPSWSQNGNVYSATPDPGMFTDNNYVDNGNPFKVPYGDKNLSCGQVVVNGVDYEEASSIPSAPNTWYADRSTGTIYIYSSSGAPSGVEITTRRGVFRPYTKGLGYITVQGFTLEYCGNNAQSYAAFGGASPRFQSGLIGTRAGHHWKIIDNTIRKAKGVGLTFSQGVDHNDPDCYDPHGVPIRVDMPNTPGWNNDNETPRTQVIPPWRKVGFCIIANNTFELCGMNAIQGIGGVGNTIYGNRFSQCMLYNFSHWAEDATVKLHLQYGTLFEKNLFENFTYDHRVLWLDNNTIATRVSRNVFLNKDQGGLPAIYFEIASSPDQYRNVVDNNLFINCVSGFYGGRADGYGIYHNLFYHCGHAFSMGSRRTPGGDDCGATRMRAYNNLCINNQKDGEYRAYGFAFSGQQNDIKADYNLITPASHYLLITGGTGNGQNERRPWCAGIDYTAAQITAARSGGNYWDGNEVQWGGCGNAPAGCTGDFGAWKGTMGNGIDLHSEERPFVDASHTTRTLTLHMGQKPHIVGAAAIKGVGVDFQGRVIGTSPKAGAFQDLGAEVKTVTFWDDNHLPPLPPLPSAPTHVTVTKTSRTTMTLTWTNQSQDAKFMHVDRRINDGPWEFHGFIPTLQDEMYDDALDTEANTYDYRVAARNATGLSAFAYAGDRE